MFGNSLAGQAAKSKQEIANLKEEIGKNFQPVVKGFYEALAGISSFFKNTISSDVGFFTKLLALMGNVKAQAEVFASNVVKQTPSVDQQSVDSALNDFLTKDAKVQQKVLDAYIEQRNQALKLFDEAVLKNDRNAQNVYSRLINTNDEIISKITQLNKPIRTGGGSGDGKSNIIS